MGFLPQPVAESRHSIRQARFSPFFTSAIQYCGEWLVLEVGTDGRFNHVDRDLGDPGLEGEIERRIAGAV